jgi:hypothetical protein
MRQREDAARETFRSLVIQLKQRCRIPESDRIQTTGKWKKDKKNCCGIILAVFLEERLCSLKMLRIFSVKRNRDTLGLFVDFDMSSQGVGEKTQKKITKPGSGDERSTYIKMLTDQSADNDVTAVGTRDRIGVNALAISGLVPVAGEWSIGETFTEDSVSGAFPMYHSSGFVERDSRTGNDAVSGASGELGRDLGLDVTRYFEQGKVSVGAVCSGNRTMFPTGIPSSGACPQKTGTQPVRWVSA